MHKEMEGKIRILTAVACIIIATACTTTSSVAPTRVPASPEVILTLPPLPTPSPTPTPPTLPPLRINLNEGDVYRIRMNATQELSQTVNDQEQNTLQSFGYEYVYSVQEVDIEGNAHIDVVYDWVLYEQNGPMGRVHYDSSDPSAEVDPTALAFSGLVGNGFSMIVSPQGEVLEISGLNEMYAGMLGKMELPNAEARAVLEQMLTQLFGEEGLKEEMNSTLFEFPEEAVQVGESWTDTTETSLIMPFTIENTYTLHSYEHPIVTIAVSSIISTDPEGSIAELGGIEFRYLLSGEQEGIVEIDVETGMTTRSQIQQVISGDMIMNQEGTEFVIPTTIRSDVDYKVTKEA